MEALAGEAWLLLGGSAAAVECIWISGCMVSCSCRGNCACTMIMYRRCHDMLSRLSELLQNRNVNCELKDSSGLMVRGRLEVLQQLVNYQGHACATAPGVQACRRPCMPLPGPCQRQAALPCAITESDMRTWSKSRVKECEALVPAYSLAACEHGTFIMSCPLARRRSL